MFTLALDNDSQELEIVTGPCSIDNKNFREVLEIWQKQINGQIPFTGVRVVGVKSRTAPTKSKDGGWIDADMLVANQRLFAQRWMQSLSLHAHPSIEMMEKVLQETPVGVATEIVDPYIQSMVMANHFWEKNIWPNRVMVWNPAVLQIGHPVQFMAQMAENFGWHVGIKNCKEQDPGVKKWSWMVEYAGEWMSSVWLQNRRIIAIHRGYDLESKWTHRNQPVHGNAVEMKKKFPWLRMYFDPSHTFWSDMRSSIVEETIKAMQMKVPETDIYLYDWMLIEAGTSTTDTKQHITLDELFDMTTRLADIRKIRWIK